MTDLVRLPVGGMTCSSCVNRIARALRRLDGVQRVRVDLRHETVDVVRDQALVSIDGLGAAIADAGYDPDLAHALVLPARTEPASLVERLRLLARLGS